MCWCIAKNYLSNTNFLLTGILLWILLTKCLVSSLHCVDMSVLCMQLPGVTGSYLSAGLCPHWTGRAEDTSKDYWNCWDVLQPARLPVRVCVCQYSYYRVVYVLCLVGNGTQWSCWGGVISSLLLLVKVAQNLINVSLHCPLLFELSELKQTTSPCVVTRVPPVASAEACDMYRSSVFQ